MLKRWGVAALTAAMWSLGGCATAPVLFPAPGVPTVPGQPGAAVVQQDGVELVVDDVSRRPPPLFSELNAVHVRVRNDGAQPLNLRADHFELKSRKGEEYVAVPPDFAARVTAEAYAASYYTTGYYGSPWYSPAYMGGIPAWRGMGYAGPGYWGPGYLNVYPDPFLMQRAEGPVKSSALPEGILPPGAQAEGFLYFRRPPTDDDPAFNFRMRLSGANNETLGEVDVPMRWIPRKEAKTLLREATRG